MFYQTDVLLQKLNVRQPAFSTQCLIKKLRKSGCSGVNDQLLTKITSLWFLVLYCKIRHPGLKSRTQTDINKVVED